MFNGHIPPCISTNCKIAQNVDVNTSAGDGVSQHVNSGSGESVVLFVVVSQRSQVVKRSVLCDRYGDFFNVARTTFVRYARDNCTAQPDTR